MTVMHIPFFSLEEQHRLLGEALLQAQQRVLASGSLILGREVAQFEEEFARFIGTRYCVGVANGTDAVALALEAGGVPPGAEVIIPAHTATATAAAVQKIGCRPVVVDIDPQTLCLDPELVAGAVSAATRAVVPVHIYGYPAPMQKILSVAAQHDLLVVEDCAQAMGAQVIGAQVTGTQVTGVPGAGRQVGTFGRLAAFSFYPTKNLGALGDGGAVVTDSPELAHDLAARRQYGWTERYCSHFAGWNSRLDELQAAFLRVKLPFLNRWNERRRAIAARYTEALRGTGVVAPTLPDGGHHVMHLYVVRCQERDRLRDYLRARGIDTALHYPYAIHQQPAFAHCRQGSSLTHTEALYRSCVSLPLFPELTDAQVEHVAAALGSWE